MGRMSGYDDNGRTIIYSHIPSCDRLLEAEKTGFTDMSGFTANTLKSNGTSIGTYNTDRDDTETIEDRDARASLALGTDYTFTIKDTAQEAVAFMKEKLNVSTRPKCRTNKEGFLTTTWHKETGPRTIDDVYEYGARQLRTRGATELSHGKQANLYPFYTDIKDNKTLKWAICHYIEEYKE